MPKKTKEINERDSLQKIFKVNSDKDVVKIREYARDVADAIGFSNNERTLIATAVSEICRNIIEYAGHGKITIKSIYLNPKSGILIKANDRGPGISDIKMALKDGYSSGRGMGVGLPGTKRIMDEFVIESKPDTGTKITMYKWVTE